MRPAAAVLLRALPFLLVASACGGGQWGYARTYEPLGPEEGYLRQQTEISYEEIKRFPDRHAETMLGWFGTVTAVSRDGAGPATLHLELRVHQDRHLCADETSASCRVTVSDRAIGPFRATVEIRPEDLVDGPDRLWRGSLVKVYGHVVDGGDDETGPTIAAQYYRHWPHNRYVTTASRGAMRR